MEKITVEVFVDVACEKVWELFTEPEHVMVWNNASPDWHTPEAVNDLTIDGKFNYRMESRDQKEGFDFWGTYTEIIPCALIAYTMGDGRKVRVVFHEQDGVTHIIETFEAENENSIELQRGGWQAILDNFKTYTEAHQ
jgi:uncharacterized protein YndB with AHSA1/START domain